MTDDPFGETIAEIAVRYGRARATVSKTWSQQDDWPAPIGRRRNAHIYDPVAVDAWLARRVHGPVKVHWIPDHLYSLRDMADKTRLPYTTLRSRLQVGLLPPADDTSRRPHRWFGATIASAMERSLYPRQCT